MTAYLLASSANLQVLETRTPNPEVQAGPDTHGPGSCPAATCLVSRLGAAEPPLGRDSGPQPLLPPERLPFTSLKRLAPGALGGSWSPKVKPLRPFPPPSTEREEERGGAA